MGEEKNQGVRVSLAALSAFSNSVFLRCGADAATADAATRSMMHGTTYGVDSHGIRLLPHYVKALQGGRLNKAPNLKLVHSFGVVATLDADHAQGALAAYTAMDHAMQRAGQFGIGAVAIRNTSHFGPAGAYAIEATRQAYIGVVFANSDSFVRLHDGAERFHGTNPISVGIPTGEKTPWLLDMATSAVPYNRVLLYRSLGTPLPQAVASDAAGIDTTDPHLAEMLAPLGGAFGFKGAALAGIAEIFSAVLSGMRLSTEIAPMNGPDFATPRQMGAFVMAIKPDAFLSKAEFEDGMQRYLRNLRQSPPREGARVMAPGDREWLVAQERQRNGVQIDPATSEAFMQLEATYGVSLQPL